MGVLEGRTAIVTGSARGIGRAAAGLLAEHGARVLVTDLDRDEAEAAAAAIPGATAVFGGDLTKDGVPEAIVHEAIEQFGQLDIVVNNAGYTWDGMAHKMNDEQFRAMLEIHTVAPFRLLRAAAPYLRDAGKADKEAGLEVFRKVVNVTSISGTQGNIGQANYSAAKAGLIGLTKTLAREWGPFKVNVNAVASGFVETRLTAASDSSNESFVRATGSRYPWGSRSGCADGAGDHPTRAPGDAGGRGGPDLLPLLAMVELRPRPGDHSKRRTDNRDDLVTFDTEAIGRGCRGRERRNGGAVPTITRLTMTAVNVDLSIRRSTM